MTFDGETRFNVTDPIQYFLMMEWIGHEAAYKTVRPDVNSSRPGAEKEDKMFAQGCMS